MRTQISNALNSAFGHLAPIAYSRWLGRRRLLTYRAIEDDLVRYALSPVPSYERGTAFLSLGLSHFSEISDYSLLPDNRNSSLEDQPNYKNLYKKTTQHLNHYDRPKDLGVFGYFFMEAWFNYWFLTGELEDAGNAPTSHTGEDAYVGDHRNEIRILCMRDNSSERKDINMKVKNGIDKLTHIYQDFTSATNEHLEEHKEHREEYRDTDGVGMRLQKEHLGAYVLATLVEGLKCLIPNDQTTLALASYYSKFYDNYHQKAQLGATVMSLDETILCWRRALAFKCATEDIGEALRNL